MNSITEVNSRMCKGAPITFALGRKFADELNPLQSLDIIETVSILRKSEPCSNMYGQIMHQH